MVGGIILIILFILAVLFLLPIRVKGAYSGGEWFVSVYYAFYRVFHKESAPKPPPPETPPKPEDYDPAHPEALFVVPEETAETEQSGKPPAEPLAAEHPEIVTDKPETPAEPAASAAEPDSIDKPEPEAEKPEPDEGIPESEPLPEEKPKKKKRRKHSGGEQEDSAPSFEETAEEETPQKPKKRGYIARLKPQGLSEILRMAKDALASLGPALRFLGKHLHFRHVKLYLSVASDDPAKTAQTYGKICAAFFPLQGQLESVFDIETDELRILSDFSGSKTDFSAALELRVSPAALILLVLILGVRFLWRTFRRFRREDKEEKLREKEQAPLPVS